MPSKILRQYRNFFLPLSIQIAKNAYDTSYSYWFQKKDFCLFPETYITVKIQFCDSSFYNLARGE